MSLEAPRALFSSVETSGRFVESNVYDAVEALEGETFDLVYTSNETYVDTGGATVKNGLTHEWNHGIGEVFTALTNAGLTVTMLEEHRHLDWRFLRQQVEVDELFYMPAEQRDLVPWQYTIQATKHAEPGSATSDSGNRQ